MSGNESSISDEALENLRDSVESSTGEVQEPDDSGGGTGSDDDTSSVEVGRIDDIVNGGSDGGDGTSGGDTNDDNTSSVEVGRIDDIVNDDGGQEDTTPAPEPSPGPAPEPDPTPATPEPPETGPGGIPVGDTVGNQGTPSDEQTTTDPEPETDPDPEPAPDPTPSTPDTGPGGIPTFEDRQSIEDQATEDGVPDATAPAPEDQTTPDRVDFTGQERQLQEDIADRANQPDAPETGPAGVPVGEEVGTPTATPDDTPQFDAGDIENVDPETGEVTFTEQFREEQAADAFSSQYAGDFAADDVVLTGDGATLDIQAQRELIAERAGPSVATSDIQFGPEGYSLTEQVRARLEAQEARTDIGGTTPSQRAQAELGFTDDVRPLIGGTTEAQREQVRRQGQQIQPGDVETSGPELPDQVQGGAPTSDLQVTDAPTAGEVEFGEQTAPENLIDSITGTSEAGAQFLRERVTTPAAEITGDVADIAVTGADVSRRLAPIGGGEEITFQEAQTQATETVGDVLRGEEQEVQPTSPLESGTENLTRGVLETGPMVVAGPATVESLAETGIEAGEFTAEAIAEEGAVEGTQESLAAGAEAGEAVVGETVEQVREQPLFTAGTLVGTAAGVGAATRVSSGFGRGVTYGQLDPENIALAGGARLAQGARRTPGRLRDIDVPVSVERGSIESAPRITEFQGGTAPRLGFDVETPSVELETDVRQTIQDVRAGERDIPGPTRPFTTEQTLTPEGVETEIEPTAARGPEALIESVRESRAAEVAGDIRRRAGRELQRIREPRPEARPEVDLSDADAVVVQDFRAETEAEAEETGPETEAGPDVVEETEIEGPGGQRQILQQEVGTETETEQTPRGIGREFSGVRPEALDAPGTEPLPTPADTTQPLDAGPAVGPVETPTEPQLEAPGVEDIFGPDVGVGPEITPRTEVGPEPVLRPEVETEPELRPETEIETETETEAETELEQELEQEVETETEFELEAESETEGEPFPFDLDSGDGRRRGPFGGEAGEVITEFVDPLTGARLETDAEPGDNPFGL